MKHPNVKTILAALVAIILIFGGLALIQYNKSQEILPDTSAPMVQDSSQPEESSDYDSLQPDSNSVPDMDSTQSRYETPYPPLNIQDLSPTTLTPEEISESIDELLAGLLKLDKAAIDRVSPQNIGGEHNPFRVMLNACLADDAIKAAFRNLGSLTTYEVLDVSNTSSSPNVFTVTVSVTTPYMAPGAAEMSASNEIPYMQELALFRASGAAQSIANMDLGAVPLSTDLVTLTVIVEDDVPLLYYPTSLTYGGRIPQYAFLWGAVEFQGVNGGDLLLRNDFGGSIQVTRQRFETDSKCSELANYLDTALGKIKDADMEALEELTVAEDTLGTHWVFITVYPEYQRLFEKNPDFEPEIWERIKSFRYELQYLIHSDAQSGTQIYSVLITYSTVDPLTKQRVYQSKQFIISPGRDTLSNSEGAMLNNLLSEILEDAFGGSPLTAESRLYLAGRIK